MHHATGTRLRDFLVDDNLDPGPVNRILDGVESFRR